MKDHELILRFCALNHALRDYSRPMKGFLNNFMGVNRSLDVNLSEQLLAEEFTRTIDCIYTSVGSRAFRPISTMNAAVFDAVSVAVANRLRNGEISEPKELKAAYDSLLANGDFEKAYKKSTADESSVRRRIELATEAFADIQ